MFRNAKFILCKIPGQIYIQEVIIIAVIIIRKLLFLKLRPREMGGHGLTRLNFVSETANSGHISRWMTVTYSLL